MKLAPLTLFVDAGEQRLQTALPADPSDARRRG